MHVGVVVFSALFALDDLPEKCSSEPDLPRDSPWWQRESMKRRQALLAVAVLLPAAWAAILGPVPAAGPAALARVPPPILGRFWEPKPGERRQAVERILEVEVRMFFSPHPRALARSLTLTIFPPYHLRSWSG